VLGINNETELLDAASGLFARLRPRPPCFLAGFCFLSAPEGRLGVCAWALRGLQSQPGTPERL
jgi:hypothetical protein